MMIVIVMNTYKSSDNQYDQELVYAESDKKGHECVNQSDATGSSFEIRIDKFY